MMTNGLGWMEGSGLPWMDRVGLANDGYAQSG